MQVPGRNLSGPEGGRCTGNSHGPPDTTAWGPRLQPKACLEKSCTDTQAAARGPPDTILKCTQIPVRNCSDTSNWGAQAPAKGPQSYAGGQAPASGNPDTILSVCRPRPEPPWTTVQHRDPNSPVLNPGIGTVLSSREKASLRLSENLIPLGEQHVTSAKAQKSSANTPAPGFSTAQDNRHENLQNDLIKEETNNQEENFTLELKYYPTMETGVMGKVQLNRAVATDHEQALREYRGNGGPRKRLVNAKGVVVANSMKQYVND
ncbi:hypothetical protein H920_18172 [Fukomys damarensis]|uniref:Uncharacterized protein n=1 Tax=Fukomys damarensis TaxID=885580 RepID=A0A091DC83_FUKDA|nr:hypothetical protein H920_18172 [Fukomys damarensis]